MANKPAERILYVISGLGGGGMERQLTQVVLNMDRSRFVLGVLTFGENQVYSEQVKDSVDFYRFVSKKNKIHPLVCMGRVFKEFNPDLVHTWDSLASFYVYPWARFHRVTFIDGSIRDAGVDKGLVFHFRRFFMKRADRVLANTAAGLRYYKVNGDIVPNLVSMPTIECDAESGEMNMIMVANFSQYKDHETFIQAAVLLLQQDSIHRAYLLGGGSNLNRWKDFVSRNHPDLHDRIVFTGFTSRISEYLCRCQIGVLCSTPEFQEGLSNSLLEYMAHGLVPVATDLGGSREVIDDGVNGFLFHAGRADELCSIVTRLRHDNELFGRVQLQARATIRNRYSREKVICQLEDLYSQRI